MRGLEPLDGQRVSEREVELGKVQGPSLSLEKKLRQIRASAYKLFLVLRGAVV